MIKLILRCVFIVFIGSGVGVFFLYRIKSPSFFAAGRKKEVTYVAPVVTALHSQFCFVAASSWLYFRLISVGDSLRDVVIRGQGIDSV